MNLKLENGEEIIKEDTTATHWDFFYSTHGRLALTNFRLIFAPPFGLFNLSDEKSYLLSDIAAVMRRSTNKIEITMKDGSVEIFIVEKHDDWGKQISELLSGDTKYEPLTESEIEQSVIQMNNLILLSACGICFAFVGYILAYRFYSETMIILLESKDLGAGGKFVRDSIGNIGISILFCGTPLLSLVGYLTAGLVVKIMRVNTYLTAVPAARFGLVILLSSILGFILYIPWQFFVIFFGAL